MSWSTADLCDSFGDRVRIVGLPLRHFGGRTQFAGQAATASLKTGAVVIGGELAQPGNGRVLVVNALAFPNAALLGDHATTRAVDNGWAGIIIAGALRDAGLLVQMLIGVMALKTCPRRAPLDGQIERDIEIDLEGCRVGPGDWIYADPDGVLVSADRLI